ncbi:MAG: hypothetical protein DRO39_08960, partial [Thermoprotei archaeon]
MRVSPSTYSRQLLAPTTVKEYCYCPAIPWIQWNYLVEPRPTPSMELGSEAKVPKLEEVAERVGLPKPRRYEVYVVDRVHGLAGKLDAVGGARSLGLEIL